MLFCQFFFDANLYYLSAFFIYTALFPALDDMAFVKNSLVLYIKWYTFLSGVFYEWIDFTN